MSLGVEGPASAPDGEALPGGFVARSETMLRVAETVRRFAATDAPVFVTGESGTGKELVARAIHRLSSRGANPMVSLNCAAFPETLLEAELFGHERGAFTGAVRRREGRFKAADGGTLLLDEICEMSLVAQAKLLRVIQEGVFEPLGTNQSTRVNVRVVAATHRNVRERVAKGLFREDLFYRLHVLPIAVPPLRERRADILPLAAWFLRRYARGEVPEISPPALAALTSAPYPGNVRELEHAIQHATVVCQGAAIHLADLPPHFTPTPDEKAAAARGEGRFLPLPDATREFEREHILRALGATGGRKGEAALLLGISRKNLWQKIKALGIRTPATPPTEA